VVVAAITMDEAGRIQLPEALKRVFGVQPGVRLHAKVTSGRIEIVREVPVVTEGVVEEGILLLPKLGVNIDAAAAIRAGRDERTQRG
jgi:bifunctional DNA-binding transcriptional regulator/antitoxin component of YhaV-PrlF toxin-antitoxin module